MKTHKWADVVGPLSPEREARITAKVDAMAKRMRLKDVRKTRALNQTTVAEAMGVPQGEISKIEQRHDMLLSTLHNYVLSLHGELVLTAKFRDLEIILDVGKDRAPTKVRGPALSPGPAPAKDTAKDRRRSAPARASRRVRHA